MAQDGDQGPRSQCRPVDSVQCGQLSSIMILSGLPLRHAAFAASHSVSPGSHHAQARIRLAEKAESRLPRPEGPNNDSVYAPAMGHRALPCRPHHA